MIRFACPHCLQPYTVPGQAAGKKSTCPACGLRLQIPAGRFPDNLEDLGKKLVITGVLLLLAFGPLFQVIAYHAKYELGLIGPAEAAFWHTGGRIISLLVGSFCLLAGLALRAVGGRL